MQSSHPFKCLFLLIYKHYRLIVKSGWILLVTELDKRSVVIEILISIIVVELLFSNCEYKSLLCTIFQLSHQTDGC